MYCSECSLCFMDFHVDYFLLRIMHCIDVLSFCFPALLASISFGWVLPPSAGVAETSLSQNDNGSDCLVWTEIDKSFCCCKVEIIMSVSV